MSVVSNVILSFSCVDDDESMLERVNTYFNSEPPFVRLLPLCVGGSKQLERPTYIAAFNYFDVQAFLAHLRSLQWSRPNAVQLFICGQDDDMYHDVLIWDDEHNPDDEPDEMAA